MPTSIRPIRSSIRSKRPFISRMSVRISRHTGLDFRHVGFEVVRHEAQALDPPGLLRLSRLPLRTGKLTTLPITLSRRDGATPSPKKSRSSPQERQVKGTLESTFLGAPPGQDSQCRTPITCSPVSTTSHSCDPQARHANCGRASRKMLAHSSAGRNFVGLDRGVPSIRRDYQISLPMATAVSAMRFEKPHSLSYQDSTRTRLPSSTLVCVAAKIDERGSWLKSIETSCSVDVGQDALQRLPGGALDGRVDLVGAGRLPGDELQVHDRDVRRRHADGASRRACR